MDTYRYHGHSMSDPGSTYRTCDEISGVRQVRDPKDRVRKLIISHDIATEKELKESPVPDSSELFTNIYLKGFGAEVTLHIFISFGQHLDMFFHSTPDICISSLQFAVFWSR
ncbi:pyruvate dehydrogenase E1 component subunit alpha-2, mitochondrial isoform X1 [Arabidopsis lyrata subsp. lyrata]|uniref:pyruvate dehydrogenase E1 component subunit alpha-2, mitochondrial isoform X1 n=1 Tax=Arabidopsis lyrata subsp. lyrata TaxID=81972 RepID=UPI000A29C979|nr:pyruvate dehydrogenase E1 component subunit alpha-2, mitochondrial isoform X1 [Arabidopsis lyrata subsp. lyrata]|eukprot:XP_020890338.1 pyruvate dehydrogenase E1 component subunit alpha-2, mitochondrial isoform X1 [Arabidopsis lyrata subsp. lyrata]